MDEYDDLLEQAATLVAQEIGREDASFTVDPLTVLAIIGILIDVIAITQRCFSENGKPELHQHGNLLLVIIRRQAIKSVGRKMFHELGGRQLVGAILKVAYSHEPLLTALMEREL